jgi:dTDP-4-dehydrorhamnose 3,5-epimerase
MQFKPMAISDVLLIIPDVYGDERGFFMEVFQSRKFNEAGISAPFVQDNHSRSKQGVLRGLHYQINQSQGKLVRTIVGEIFDVAVDLRKSSPTFGEWVGTHLSEDNKYQLWIPPGFAHGFFVLSDWGEVLYKTTDFYAPEFERTLLWNDPDIGVQWPFLNGQSPVLSSKDKNGRPFKLLQEEDIFP